jgi:hypothetical protein
MAGRHACVVVSGAECSIRDLESPGGTFVNRQRLLSGQARALAPGDLVQVGAVQLEVKRENHRDAPAEQREPSPIIQRRAQGQKQPQALSIPYRFAGGSTCKTWDDFLVLAAQRWSLVSAELSSGRLTEQLRRIGRGDLAPGPELNGSPDERLDAWLGRLPVSQSSEPELDVHPQALVIQSATGGGVVRKTLRIANVGYRLLRSTVRVEPPGCKAIQVPPSFTSRGLLTVDQTELPIDIELPEVLSHTTLGAVVIESNGGRRRIDIVLEPAVGNAATAEIWSSPVSAVPVLSVRPLAESIAEMSLGRRLIILPLAFLVLRLVVFAANLIPFTQAPENRFEPRLASMALLLAALGGLFGAWRGSDPGDRAACGFTGALAGVLLSALGYALFRAVESVLGQASGSPALVLLLSAMLGIGLTLLSWAALPRKTSSPPHPPLLEPEP